MTRALWRKEARALVPFLFLVVVFTGLDWVYILSTEFPDQYPLARFLNETDTFENLLPGFILAIALAAGLLVRERDEGTLDFLDALPVSRTRVFLAKYVLGLGLLLLLPLSGLVAALTFHALSRTSLDPGFHWDLLLTSTVLDACSCFVYFSIGLALSFLRRFSFLVLGLLFWAYLLLREFNVPHVELFNLFAIGLPVFEGQRWLIPTKPLLVQLALGVFCSLLAYGGFLAIGDRTARWTAALGRVKGAGLILSATTAIVLLLWIGLLVRYSVSNFSEDEAEVVYPDRSSLSQETDFFAFVYPSDQKAQAEALIAESDLIHRRVLQFLRAEAGGRTVVDLTGNLPRHSGRAYWKKIRMNLIPGADLETLTSILAHETTHVAMEQASQSRLFEKSNSTRFFHEGLASYVEYRLFRSEESHASLRRVAAVSRARDQFEIEELFDDATLTAKLDPDLVYPLGEVFVEALIARYGEAAPGKILAAFARADAPENLAGTELWQDVLQACQFNLSEVIDQFFALLDRAVADQRDFIDSLPRLQGALETEPGRIGIRPVYAGNKPGRIVCRFRARSDTPDRFYQWSWPDATGVHWARRANFSGRSFWYQLGWTVSDASQVLYEAWVEVPL